MKQYKISYTAFGNFGGKSIHELEDPNDIKAIHKLIYEEIKDESWDWEFNPEDLEINKVTEYVVKTPKYGRKRL